MLHHRPSQTEGFEAEHDNPSHPVSARGAQLDTCRDPGGHVLHRVQVPSAHPPHPLRHMPVPHAEQAVHTEAPLVEQVDACHPEAHVEAPHDTGAPTPLGHRLPIGQGRHASDPLVLVAT